MRLVHHRLAVFFALATLAALAVAMPVRADAQTSRGNERYKVRKGDTLELIAAEYYGNRVHKIYIMVENGLDHDKPLKPGQRLRIPVSERITTEPGDTLASLADVHLGNSSRVAYLAEFNNMKPTSTLAVGQELTIPMRVNYRANGSEKLRDIALSLFADARQASLLRDYNGLDSDELSPGQIISVPVPKVQIQASKFRPPDAEASARATERRTMMERAQRALPRARNAWHSGDFAKVKQELTKLDVDYLDTELATEAGLLLGSAYIAFDDVDSALATFSKVARRNGEVVLDPKEHSPKVREVWSQAADTSP
jgi:LysM repeat protein